MFERDEMGRGVERVLPWNQVHGSKNVETDFRNYDKSGAEGGT